MGRSTDALESFRRAMAILETLAQANPTVTDYQRDLAGIRNDVGVMLAHAGHPDEALELY